VTIRERNEPFGRIAVNYGQRLADTDDKARQEAGASFRYP
jgi:hypothetical protein